MSLCRQGSGDNPQQSLPSNVPPSSLQIYSLPDFNVTRKNMGETLRHDNMYKLARRALMPMAHVSLSHWQVVNDYWSGM